MKKTLFISILSLITVLCCGCGQESLPEEKLSEAKTEAAQASEMVSEQRLLYADDSLGVQLYEVLGESKSYCIKYGEMENYMDVEGDISDIRAEAWGEADTFIALQFKSEGENQVYVIETENLGEIRIKNPYETISQYITMDISEEEDSLYLQLAQKKIEITASNENALTAISQAIKPGDTIHFGSDDTGVYCDMPIIFEGGETALGAVRLYYEFDGVGLNCVSAEFLE